MKEFIKRNPWVLFGFTLLLVAAGVSYYGTFNGNLIGNSSTSTVSTNAMNLPNVAYIETNNTYIYNGVTYGPYADQTLTISNAWNQFALAGNSYALGGDVTYIMPGFHYIGRFTLTWPPSSTYTNPSCMTIEGPGILAAVLLNTNLTPVDSFHIGTVKCNNGTGFHSWGVTYATWTNAPGTNIIYMGNQGDASGGGLADVDIHDCLFTCWSGMTNNWPGFSPDIFPLKGGAFGLIALNINNGSGDIVSIHHNWFDFVAGVSLANDHGALYDNIFEGDGSQMGANQHGLTNLLFATSSPFYAGFPVVFLPSNGGGHLVWDIYHNEFVSGSTVGDGYMFLDGNVARTVSFDDYEINSGSQTTVIATSGAHITEVCPFGLSALAANTLFWDVTNTANFSTLQQDTGLVLVASWNNGLSGYVANMNNTNNNFAGTFNGSMVGDASLATNYPAANLAASWTNYGVITVSEPAADYGTLPPNIFATYTFCYTNAAGISGSGGFSVFTNNLPVTTNVVINNGGQYLLAPSNELNAVFTGTPTFLFAAPSVGTVAGGWPDAAGTYSGYLLAAFPTIVNAEFQTTTNYNPSTWAPVPGSVIQRNSNNTTWYITTIATNKGNQYSP